MMVLKDRILFMFSEENTDNLWKKTYFQCIFLIFYTISIICFAYFIGYQICYIAGLGTRNRSIGSFL